MDGLLTVSEAAAMLRVSGRTVRRWVKSGILPGIRLPGRGGGEVRVEREAVERLLSDGITRTERGAAFETVDRCQGITKDGEPCQGLAVKGTKFCRHHQEQEGKQ